MAKETKVFETEVQQILDMMIHSLYSQREVFLRELVSNASDALDKLRYEEVVNKDIKTSSEEKYIRVTPNSKNKTLVIEDNGIGMSYDEVVTNIGTIAYSGTKNFLAKAKELKDRPDLIGQFGVGFYSAFMVADKITLETVKAGSQEKIIWESALDGKYSIEKVASPDAKQGTRVILHLKDAPKDEENAQDFTDQWTIKSLVKKYSDFISYPIKMVMEKQEAETDAEGKDVAGKYKTVETDEVLNSQKALWLRNPKEVTEQDYKDFYKHVTNDWTDPLEHIHYRAEGTQEFSALMFVPSVQPFDYNQRDMKYGLSLYVRRVFILDNCEQLLPQHLRFVKGVIDSSDLPLNVSREMIQQDRQIAAIKKAVAAKIHRSLATMLEKEREKYDTFWGKFGATLKEGIATDFANKETLMNLALFYSSNSDKRTTLKEYVERMPAGQKNIYFMTGESIKQLSDSPHLEKLKEKKYEVLYMIDPVDEWVMNTAEEFEGKKFLSVLKEDLELDSEEEKKSKEEALKEKEVQFKTITESIKKALASNIKDVRLSDRLVDSPACLVSGANDPSAHMERMMEAMGQSMPKSKRILEINPSHPIFERMKSFDEGKISNWAEILYNQALLNEGSPLENPTRFSKQISELMLGH